MFTAILTRLSPYAIWIRLGLLLVLVVASFVFGYRYRSGIESAARLDLVISQAKAKEAMQNRSDALAEKLEQKATNREIKMKIVTKEVTKYVQKSNACQLDSDYRRMHDMSAGSRGFSDAAGVPDAVNRKPEGSATNSNDVLETVSENYATCLRWKDQVDGWQEFWVEVLGTRKNN